MKHSEDHFSQIASQYVRGRIGYPSDLYRFLSARCRAHHVAWDCATGFGQAAQDLARCFTKVIATDISEELLNLAPRHPGISHRLAAAEESGIEADSVDLITVAQAIHWFDLPQFWIEVSRVLKDGGVLAFWGYNWPVASPAVDRVLEEFKVAISPSWPERSAILHDGYRSIVPPFPEIQVPAFEASASWALDDYLAHLRSWSATRYYNDQTGGDVVGGFTPAFADAWGNEVVRVSWPLIVRVFRKG